MTKTIVILAHPNMKESRVNKALIHAAQEVDSVQIHNLSDQYPDGKIDVAKEQEMLKDVDHIVFQFPLYWYSAPALLKDWLDQVMTYGWAHGSKGKALVGKTLSLVVSIGSSLSSYHKEGAQGHTVDDYLLPFRKMASYINLSLTDPFYIGSAYSMTDEELKEQATAYRQYLINLNENESALT